MCPNSDMEESSTETQGERVNDSIGGKQMPDQTVHKHWTKTFFLEAAKFFTSCFFFQTLQYPENLGKKITGS